MPIYNNYYIIIGMYVNIMFPIIHARVELFSITDSELFNAVYMWSI